MEKKFIDVHANNAEVITEGINVSKYIACGKIAFNPEMVTKLALEEEPIILVKDYLYPEDVELLKRSQGLILTRHQTGIFALMMAKTLKKSCILANNVNIDLDNQCMLVNNKKYPEGTIVSLDGHTGNIYLGSIPQVHMLGYNDLTRRELKNKIYYK